MKINYLIIAFAITCTFVLQKTTLRAQSSWPWAKSETWQDVFHGGGLIKDVAADASGNVYIAGQMDALTITFDTFTLTNSSSITGLRPEILLVKYDRLGNVLWAKNEGSIEEEVANSVATDVSGNIYITGYFKSPIVTFGSFTLTNSGGLQGPDIFLVKYDAAGNVLWAKNSTAQGVNAVAYPNNVSTDAFGNVYISGNFTSTLTLEAVTLTATASKMNSFLAKFDASGTLKWAKTVSGDWSYCNGMSVDPFGNIIITGEFGSYTTTNPSSISFGWDPLESTCRHASLSIL